MKYFVLVLSLFSLNLKAQNIDSLSKVKNEYNLSNPKKLHSYIIPTVFVSYGLISLGDNAIRDLDLSTKAELSEDHPKFAAHVDDYAQFAPVLAVYGLNLAGIKGRHNLFDESMLYATSATIMGLSTHFVKRGVHRLRPDGSGYNSFPSGHTASAFAAAEFLYQEFKYKSPWIGYAGYFVATATGTLRMYNNKHWFSDVVAGAGFGIASTKLGYLVYPHIKRWIGRNGQEQHLSFMPAFEQHRLCYSITYKL